MPVLGGQWGCDTGRATWSQEGQGAYHEGSLLSQGLVPPPYKHRMRKSFRPLDYSPAQCSHFTSAKSVAKSDSNGLEICLRQKGPGILGKYRRQCVSLSLSSEKSTGPA